MDKEKKLKTKIEISTLFVFYRFKKKDSDNCGSSINYDIYGVFEENYEIKYK